MAEIYKAKTYGAEGFEKLLAIKRILPHCSADKEFITMLIDEAKLSVLLSHANIVQVYDLGKVGEDYFISMEFINGVNLRDIVYRCREGNRPIPPELALYIMSEICKGLDYAHRKSDSSGKPVGIVHRDVSPQNILISYEGEVKIVDFGIAKAAMNISHTMAGILKGKIAYMSPEQALGKSIDHRTDIFSVGIILYECLTGKKLFTGESQFEVLKKIRTTRITRDNLPDTLPLALREIMAKTLAYLPKDRYASAGDLQTDLTRLLYSTYVDFTPQRVASFIRELFADELQRQQSLANARHHRERQTESLSFVPVGIQQNIVHRPDTTDPAARMGPADRTPARGTVPLPPERSLGRIEEAPPRLRSRMLVAAGVVIALIGIGAGYFEWIHPRLFPIASSGTVATVHIISQPPGADIAIDGKALHQQTPAMIENLEVERRYTVALTKTGYQRVEHHIIPTSAEPITLELAMVAAKKGTLIVNSEPAGATILINEQPTDLVTPATLKDLALDTPITITLQKASFEHFSRTITLDSGEPKELVATLSASSTDVPAAIELPQEPVDSGLKAITAPELPSETPAVQKPKGPDTTTPAATTSFGSLRVVTDPPGAAIYLNGKRLRQKTPATLKELAVGKSYAVRVAKEGYTGWTRNVTMQSTKEITLSQGLKPREPSATPPVATTSPPARIGTQEASIPQVPTGLGSITVESKPKGATVFVDGHKFGRAPITIRGIAHGARQVRLEMKGYATWSQSVQIENGKERFVKAGMQPLE